MCARTSATAASKESENDERSSNDLIDAMKVESAVDIARTVSAASAAFRKPAAFMPSYGTAGFRAEASLLDSTLFRCGVLMAARSLSKGGAVTGICVTASHNPPRDNGVKLIDPSGHVLDQRWEPRADRLARADGGAALEALSRALFEEVLAEASPSPSSSSSSAVSPPRPVVWIAHDSRPSSPGLAAAAKAGAEAGGASAEVLGEMTTPQLHWLVAAANTGGPRPTLEDYYDELSRGHAELVAGTEPLTTKAKGDGNEEERLLFVDAAAGVGGGAASRLAAKCERAGLLLRVANGEEVSKRDPEALNHRRGSDFVQKTRELPDGMRVVGGGKGGDDESENGAVVSLPPRSMCASLDGDADRVVFFSAPAAAGAGAGAGSDKDGVSLLDGDRIASLLALFVKEKILARGLSRAAEEQGEGSPLTIGQVQTAYANGAARAFAAKALLSRPSGDGAGPSEPSSAAAAPLARTGVKHLHAAAEKFDVGVYFEANGHGALLLSPRLLRVARRQREKELGPGEGAGRGARPAPPSPAALALALARASNQAVGDALSGLLLVDAALRHLRWDFGAWQGMYTDLPSRQRVVRVADRSVLGMSDDESAAVAPAALAAAVEAAVGGARRGSKSSPSLARAFARPSGTEDVVRVYAEADTREACEALALEVARAVWDHAGGVGERP